MTGISTMQRWARATLATCMALSMSAWLTACGGSDDPAVPPPAPPPSEGSATIDAAGGFVDGPDGVRLGVPAGAVDSGVTFRIARNGSGAPLVPEGVDLVSAVYAITPHGQQFNLPVSVRVPSNPAQVAGRATFLMKAAPGGRWAVIGTDSAAATALQSSIDSLSYFAIGACTNNLPPNSIGSQNCPTANVLRFELLTDAGTPFPVSQDTSTGAIQPVTLITTPTTLTGRITWTRAPFSFAREDRLESGSRFTGTAGGVVVERQAGIAWSAEAPNGLVTTQNLSKTFTITVTPAQVAAARSVNGVVRPLWAQAVAGPWEYNALIPIRIRDVSAPPPSPSPTITQQPANAGVVEGQPASFSVAASITPAAALTYQWSRRADTSAAFAPIAGATAATLNFATTALTDNGAQFQVVVCAAPTRCVTSSPATLTVTSAPIAPSFTLQPVSIAVVAGQTASFTVTATGSPLPRIDWQSAPASDPNNFTSLSVPNCARTDPPASGTITAATCTIGTLAIGDSGRRYRAAATNSAATTNSTVATLTVNAVPVAPAITQQPQAQTTTVGGSATFSVTATGTAPLNYTWQQGGFNLPSVSGAFNAGTCSGTVTYSNGNATITLSGLSAGCNGVRVTVEVSNSILPVALSNSVTLTVNPATLGLSLLAGAIGGPGTVDGTGSEARVTFTFASGIAVDAAGTAYFSDSFANRLRKVTAAGVVTTLPEPLLAPAGVAVDSAGNAYVAERGGHRILRFSPAGTVSVWAGRVQGDQDGTGTQALLSNPEYLTIDANDNLYVTQNASFAPKIRKISPTQQVTTFHDFGGPDGVGAIAAAADGSLYGLGNGALAGTVQRITPAGVVTLVAGAAGESGNIDGSGAAARFNLALNLVVVASGDLYVTDANNQAVRRVTPAGVVTTVSGSATFPVVPSDGTGTAGRYGFPTAIGRAPNGDLLVGDTSTIRRLTPSFALTTPVGQWLLATGTADGSGSAARFRGPSTVVLDAGGNAYVADLDRVRVVSPLGAVSTLAVTPTRWIARDGAGFVVASSNAVWRMTAAGVPTPLAGDPSLSGYVDSPTGSNARFGDIRGLAVDAAGNVFVGEAVNGNATLRRITPDGAVTTFAGAQGAFPETLDGRGSAARFGFLGGGLAFDASGNLFVAESAAIRRVSPQGDVTTVVTAAAGLIAPLRLAFEPGGALLAGGDATLQRISPNGAVTTLLGTQSVRGVKLGTAPQLNIVNGMAVRPNGRIVLTSEAAVLEATIP